MTYHLPHAADDCTGEWRLIGRRGDGTWGCDICPAMHPSTPENDRAADLEFARGMQLRSQTRQGRFSHLFRSPKPRGPHLELPHPDEDDGVH